MSSWVKVRQSWIRGRRDDMWETVRVQCVPTFNEHVTPPAGEEYAFDVQHYRRTVEVFVSPTGRSVRVYVDGKEVR